jgi:phosphoadenosine phosphosulfate reductase
MSIPVTNSETASLSESRLWQMPPITVARSALAARQAELHVRLKKIASAHHAVQFATSLAAEDMVLTHAIFECGVPITIFTLDTGRLPTDTLSMISTVEQKYHTTLKRFMPKPDGVESFIAQYGLNGFFDSEEAKKACCDVRKVEPLNRALQGCDAWLTGQRREQTVTRSALLLSEQDEARGIAKYNPLFDWTEAEVWSFLQFYQVPIHPLHARGYPSIGCDPCTRAIRQNEDIRAGRWWWLQSDSKECGLHVNAL